MNRTKRTLLSAALLVAPAILEAADPAVLFVDAATNAPSGAPARYRSLKLFRSRYSPEEYGELRAAREAEERADRAPLRLEGPGVAALFEGRAFGDGLSNVLARAVEPAPTDDLYTEFSRTTVDVSRAPEEWTVETTTRRRILTYAGQRKAGDLTFRWNPATTDFEVVDARVISPDGAETPVDPKLDLFEGDQEWVADAPRYPAGRLATVSFPKLAPGMSVQWTTRRRAHDRDLFSFAETLGSLGSFGEISVTVAGTNDLARAFRVEEPFWKTIADRFPVETNATDSATTYTVRGGGPGSQIVSEPNMPPLSRLAPVLRVSSQTAPERAAALAARMWALSDPATQTNASALARSIVATNATVREAFVALRDWCAINLREAGPAYWDLSLAALSPADATLAARYGHEADLRILQLAMARALDRDAEISLRLYNAAWNADPTLRSPADVPAAPATFDTIAVGFSDHVFDGATQYAHPLADRNRDLPALVWRPDLPAPDEVVLLRPSFGYPFRNWGELLGRDGVRTRYDIDVRTNGSARIRVAVEHGGTAFEAFRKRYEQILPEERRRDAQRRVAAFAQSARLVGDVETETPPDGPCVLRFEAEVPDFAQPCGNGLAFRDPGLLPVSPPAARRRFPFRRASSSAEMTESVVHLPEGWVATCRRPSIGLDRGRDVGADVRLQCSPPLAPGGTMFLTAWRVLEPIEFPPESYEGFLAGSLGLRGPDADTIRIHPPEPADSRFLAGATPESPSIFGLRIGDRPDLDEGGTNASFRIPAGRFFVSDLNVRVPDGRRYRFVPTSGFDDKRFDFVAAVVDEASGRVVRVSAHIDFPRPDGTPVPDLNGIAAELFDVFGSCETILNSDMWDSGDIWRVFFLTPGSVGVSFSIHQQFGTTLDLFEIDDPSQMRGGIPYPTPEESSFAKWIGAHPFASLYETNAVRRASRASSAAGPDESPSKTP